MRNHFNYRRRIWGQLRPYVGNLKKDMKIMLISGFLGVIIALLPPLLYQMFIDQVLIQKELARMGEVFIGLLLIFIAGMLVGAVKQKSQNKVRMDMTWRIQNQILQKYVTGENYVKDNPGELKKVIENDVLYLAEFIERQASDYYMGILSILLLHFMLFRLNWQMALISVGLLPLTYWLDYRLARKENEIETEVRYLESGRYQFVLDSLDNWKEVKTLGLGKRLLRKYVQWLHRWARFNMTYINHAMLKDYVLPRIKELLLGRVFIYLIGSFLVLKGKFTIGGLLVFAQYYYDILCRIEEFSKLEFAIEENKVHYDKVLELLEKEQDGRKHVLTEPVREIRFEQVSFKYEKEMRFGIRQASFVLKEGDKAAFVGLSGSGKTTIVKLLMHQCRAADGRILVNGVDIEDLDIHALHRKIGFVMQDSRLINMSIRENILLGNPEAGEEEIIEACQRAGIWKDIEELEEGLDTMAGENGIRFSGGQCQRIILARVFLQNPDVYIFDEATSALDSVSEQHINQMIKGIQGKIVLIIAHSPSAVQFCKSMYVVREGIVNAAAPGEHIPIRQSL